MSSPESYAIIDGQICENGGARMKLHADCVACLTRGALGRAKHIPDGSEKTEYMRRICEILGATDAEYDSAPLMDAKIIQLGRELLGIEDDYTEIKRSFNALLLGVYDQLKARVRAAEDPLRAAIQFSMVGNYIDFNILENVDEGEALRLLDEASNRELDAAEVEHLRADLARGGEMVFVHDNCGEIVLDKLLIETIRELYPDVRVVSLIRCQPVANDATWEDAEQIGLSEVAEVLDNGLPDLPGTQVDQLPAPVRACVESAALLIAKGQGNFESMIECGLNVYYILLSKCASYTEWYGFAHMSGVLVNERRRKF